jgi:hypothetical protein
MENKCKCGKLHDGWPGEDGGLLCQDCWEAECSKSWWAVVRAVRNWPAWAEIISLNIWRNRKHRKRPDRFRYAA